MESKKKTRKKSAMLILILGIILIFVVLLAAPPKSPFASFEIHQEIDAADFLNSLGWESDTQNITVQNSLIPNQFDNVFLEYNELQKKQNCDLTKYAGEEVIIYTVPIKNYINTSENVYATLIVHQLQIIGGDIHSAKLDGFMHTLR